MGDNMKIVKVERSGQTAEGFLDGEDVRIVGGWINGAAERAAFSLSQRSASELRRLHDAAREIVPLASVTLAVPADPLAKIVCIGMNYRDHLGEIKIDESPDPVIFTRSLDSLVGHRGAIVRAKVSETFDFEGEIAVIIGREGRHIPAAEALEYVGGYTCFMDGSIRQYQKHSVTAGKNFWRSGAMGPWIVPADEFGPKDPALATRLNGEIVQSSRASMMIFDISRCIAYVSQIMPLRPGDVIATGTPGGVGSRRTPPLWMKPGDTIEVEVEGVGTLCNAVIDEVV